MCNMLLKSLQYSDFCLCLFEIWSETSDDSQTIAVSEFLWSKTDILIIDETQDDSVKKFVQWKIYETGINLWDFVTYNSTVMANI